MSELTARFDLPLDRTAPAMARRVVRPVLVTWGFWDVDWLADAELVLSELVSNAVRHGAHFVSLDLQAHGVRATIGVADGSAVVPTPRAADEAGGRGIQLIEALGCRWGVHDHEGGKRVWAELPPHPGAGKVA